MKISGFTLCRNGVRLGFPFRESIKSLATYCDEVVVVCGAGEDNTEEELQHLAKELPCPLRIINTVWDPAATKGGSILADQTNIALDACAHEIVFYLQGDEILHEDDVPLLKRDIARLVATPEAMSIVLQWVHFFGDSQTVAHSRKWYRKEIRVFKKSSGLRSFKDAQSFRKLENGEWSTLPAIESLARVLHYGWVRPADLMALKSNEFQHWWHGKSGSNNKVSIFRPQYGIYPYNGTHPLVMQSYLSQLPKPELAFHEINRVPLTGETMRLILSQYVEKASGIRMGEFKSYSKIIK